MPRSPKATRSARHCQIDIWRQQRSFRSRRHGNRTRRVRSQRRNIGERAARTRHRSCPRTAAPNRLRSVLPTSPKANSRETCPEVSRSRLVESATFSPSSGRAGAGSTAETTSASKLQVDRSIGQRDIAGEVAVDRIAAQRALRQGELVGRKPHLRARHQSRQRPAAQRLGLSIVRLAAVAEPITGPERSVRLNALECNMRARSVSMTSFVDTDGSFAVISRIQPRLAAMAQRPDRNQQPSAISIGLSAVPNANGILLFFATSSTARSVAPLGSERANRAGGHGAALHRRTVDIHATVLGQGRGDIEICLAIEQVRATARGRKREIRRRPSAETALACSWGGTGARNSETTLPSIETVPAAFTVGGMCH